MISSLNSTVRIWNYSTGDALTILNHEDFVYSLVSIPSLAKGGLASSGEDGLVKIWNESDGECDQIIEVPALSGELLSLSSQRGQRAEGESSLSLVTRYLTERRSRLWVFRQPDLDLYSFSIKTRERQSSRGILFKAGNHKVNSLSLSRRYAKDLRG